VAAETREIPRGARDVLIRYGLGNAGSGLINVVAEAGYEPAGRFMPYDVTYAWDEYHRGEWVERYHRERIKHAYHEYAINVAGERPPKMNWLRVEPAGEETTGYEDGVDVGPGADPSAYRLVYGSNVSPGCRYRVSRSPSKAYPDVGRRLLTDGFIGRPGVQGLDKIDLSAPRNKKRAHKIVAWEPGESVLVTIDLGKQRSIAGARIAALQPNQRILYPSVMQVEVSPDDRSYNPAGLAGWEDCFFPPGDELRWEGWDSPVYRHLPAGGIISYKFPVLFLKPVKARYVRFRLVPMDDKAGMALWELEVFDGLRREPWDERIALPVRRR
jgi:hypothetical protein